MRFTISNLQSLHRRSRSSRRLPRHSISAKAGQEALTNSRLSQPASVAVRSVQPSPGQSPQSAILVAPVQTGPHSALAGFTMMEIAISLAIIGIALVAIIGVLPIGMNVQKETRQETIVGQDASVFMEAIRNGSLGLDDLTNYVYAITNYWGQYNANGVETASGVNGYTYSGALNAYASGYPTTVVGEPLTNGANIVGLLSTPEYIGAGIAGDLPGQSIPSLFYGGISNHIVAYCHSISGPAYEKPPQDNPILQGDSFGYRMFCVNAPTATDTNLYSVYPLWTPGTPAKNVFYNWTYWSLPSGASPALAPGNVNSPWQMVPNFSLEQALNLHELRLTFEWPQLPNGRLGSGRRTFRTLIAGQLQYQPGISSAYSNPSLYRYQAQSFTNTP